MQRLKKVDITWSPSFAYVIGIITTDGNLSPDKRHINITSKDKEIVTSVKKLLKLKNKIGKKARGGSKNKKYFVLQFGDINFYDFLLSIGLTPAKSKILKKVSIPTEHFRDFLRGCIDGDGSIDGFVHPQSKLFQYRVRLISASPKFLLWMLSNIQKNIGATGGTIYRSKSSSVSILSFGKSDARKMFNFMYYKRSLPALRRKYLVAQKLLAGE